MPVDVAVIGLGYVGLPLAQEAARVGLRVVGLDTHAGRVRDLNAGRSHVDDLSDGEVAAMVAAGFRATTDEAVLGEAETVVICVPTPLGDDGGPDLRPVRAAVDAVARHLRPGVLVVLESTTYPGTTDEVVRGRLEETGLLAGADFWLAFSPERIDPGNPQWGLRNTPKIVGGHTAACTERAAAFYGRVVDTVVRVRGTREAELAKLLENTYRHVNIALVNEMAVFCHDLGIDVWDVIGAARTKPFGFQAFYPGPGVGGHCIPIDPNYLSYKVRTLGYPFRFVELAQEVNARMPAYVAQRALLALNADGKALNGSTVLLLGVTYKADVADARESPAAPLARRLRALGAEVEYHDPLLPAWCPEPGLTLTSVPDLGEALDRADLTVLLQAHRALDADLVATRARRVLDTRGRLTGDGVERL